MSGYRGRDRRWNNWSERTWRPSPYFHKPTIYDGVLFRSALESKWAKFFDDLDIRWTYEPKTFWLGSNGALKPDFRIDFWPGVAYVEVKPTQELMDDDKLLRCWELSKRYKVDVLLLIGSEPDSGPHKAIHPDGSSGEVILVV